MVNFTRSKILFFVAPFLFSTGIFSQSTTATFNCGSSTWTVPACVTSISVTLEGAQGGGTAGGLGAIISGTLAVTPGQNINIVVGCQPTGVAGGGGGGGAGANATGAGNASFGGGGASSISIGGTVLAMAGGGGGTGGGNTDGSGGAGGCPTGGAGTSPFGQGGGGATTTAGGTGGPPWITSGFAGASGTFGQGGAGGSDPCYNLGPGGGGGGGYYGGGGGGSDCFGSGSLGGGGGGGGSSFLPPGFSCSGTNTGNGVVTITYTASSATATAANTGPYCAGATIQLSATGGGTYSWSGPGGYTATGQNPTRPAATTAMSGVYTVTVTSVGGCTTTATTSVTVNPLPTPTAANTGPYCAGSTIQLSATGGGTYSWSGPSSFSSTLQNPTRPTSTVAMSGVYTVTVTVGTCTATATTNVTVNPIPTPTASNPGPFCTGGTVQLNATGGGTYSWSGPSAFTSTAQNPTQSPATAAMAGVYTVTVTANNCTATATTTVAINTGLVPNISSNSPVCENDALNLTCANGVSWNWTGPGGFTDTNQNPTINPAMPTQSGAYSISATDANGCIGTATINVVVNPLPVVTATSATICAGQATANLSAAGASSYVWSAGTTPSNAANVSASPSATTIYTVTGTDANNCVSTATSTVTVNAVPVVTVNSPAVCPGITANLTASGASTYTWSPGTTPSNAANVTASPAATTSYLVIGTDANGCIDSAVAVVTVNAQLVINAGIDDTVCAGDNIPLNASGPAGTTYTWMPGSLGGASQSIVATASTTYTLSGVDANGCTGSDSVLVTVPAAIVLNAAGFPASCSGVCDGQMVVLATPNTGPFSTYTYLWSNGGTNASENGICAGNYNVTVTNNAGCSATAAATVTEPVSVTAVVGATTPASCNAVCDGGVTITLSGGTAPYTYSWNNGNTTNNPVDLCAGNNICNWADANGCSGTSTVTITEPAVISASVAPVATICIGQTATLTASASGGNGGYVYTWTAGTVPANAATVTASPVGTTSYTVSVTDVNSCPSVTASVTVTVNPPLSVNASNNVVICAGQSTSMTANASGGNGVYTYSWAAGTTPGTGQNVNASPAGTTTYTVTVTDGCGTPSSADSVLVTVNPLPTLNITVDTVSGCNPLCVNFTAVSFPTSSTVNWTFNGGAVTSANGTPVGPICFADAGVYGATINVTDINGCQNSFTNNNLVTVYPTPSAEFSFSPDPATVASPVVSFTDQSAGATITDWLWNFGDLNDSVSAVQHPVFTYEVAGNYDVWLTVTSDHGCMDSINHTVVINPEFLIYVPNAFSPNGDAINDTFFPKGIGVDVDNFEMWIYDRWGNMIWATKDWSQGWDGKVSGSSDIVQQDVYVWKIKLRTWSGDKKSYVGHVTVVK